MFEEVVQLGIFPVHLDIFPEPVVGRKGAGVVAIFV
jgi:hypothetical protein